MTENLPRVLPEGLGAEIDLTAWRLPPVFAWLNEVAGMEQAELLKTFNCGIGLILVVEAGREAALSALLAEAGETVIPLGAVTEGQGVSYQGTLA